jgi:hypothetical protein
VKDGGKEIYFRVSCRETFGSFILLEKLKGSGAFFLLILSQSYNSTRNFSFDFQNFCGIIPAMKKEKAGLLKREKFED